ncbi:DUF2225 domain-containing protein [Clostridium carnis]
MSNIFQGLEKLGFTNINSSDLFKKLEPNEKKKEILENPLNYLFLKDVKCPICNKSFKTPAVKVNSYRKISTDSDFFIRYSIINPYFYDVWLCPYCGYAAMKAEFSKIRSFQKDLVKEKISSKWVGREYNDIFTEKIAIERYKLALLNAMIMESKSSCKAMICLKIAWMYRLLEDKKQEDIFLSQALIGFTDAFCNEDFPMYGLDKFSLTFLLGELCRRLNKDQEALKWFSDVITSIRAPQKIKEMARDGKDKIKLGGN